MMRTALFKGQFTSFSRLQFQINAPRNFSVLTSADTNKNLRGHHAKSNILSSQTLLESQIQLLSQRNFSRCLVLNAEEAAKAAAEISKAASEAVTKVEANKELILDFIPKKPTPLPSSTGDASAVVDPEVLTTLIEPTMYSLGLGSWWPWGRMQIFLEWMHIEQGLPWWGAIMVATAIIRVCVFPLIIKSQKNAAKMAEVSPKMMELQTDISNARRRGDMLEMTKQSIKMEKMMKEKNYNPFMGMVPTFLQFPFFISMFTGLRQMANAPVESFETGGLFWFYDLTMSDPFYILPATTATMIFFQMRVGADGIDPKMMAGKWAGVVMKGVPVIIFLATMNQPTAVGMYWTLTSFVSIVQAKALRVEKARKFFGIPKREEMVPKESPKKKKFPKSIKGFRESVRESMDNISAMRDVQDRRMFDEKMFAEAGRATPKRIYKFDPTKPIRRSN